VYIDIGPDSGVGAAVLSFTLNDKISADREWEIRVAQIPCGASYK
jgi:hypothetical protein